MEISYIDHTSNQEHFDQIHDLLKSEADHMLVFSAQEIKEFIEKNQAIVAVYDNKVIGFIKYFIQGFDNKLNKKILECGSLVIDPEFRKKGVAKKLITSLSQKIKGDSMLVSVVRKNNKVSEAFLRRIGALEISKPEVLVIYPLGWSEDKFYFFSLNNIKNEFNDKI